MKYLIALLFVVASQAFAFDADHRVPPTEPHYWMKAYPGAEPAKVQRCLAEAQVAFYKKLTGGVMGSDVPWAVLDKGNAWEKCMDGK